MLGRDHLTAAHCAEGSLTAELRTIDAGKDAIPKTQSYLIVLAHRTLSPSALVGKLRYPSCLTNRGYLAQTQSLTAPNLVGGLFRADTNAPIYVIPTNVCPVY